MTDAIGFLASSLVLMTFSMKTMGALRLVAIFSNIAFISYGVMLDLAPIWMLHALLLPINAWRCVGGWSGLQAILLVFARREGQMRLRGAG
ncbi:MAG: hypothetical protein AAGH74_04410 [Pseudomonadota bacterium]